MALHWADDAPAAEETVRSAEETVRSAEQRHAELDPTDSAHPG
jgi:hypothetical protein